MSIPEKLEKNIEVYFVQSDSSHNQASDIMKSAFDSMTSFDFDPVWIKTDECLNISEKESKIFIMDPFEGKAFEHLKSLHCRIIGPLCISYCLRYGDALPKRPYPIYSVSMRKLTVCCSNIESEKRNDIRRKVQLMGGFFSRDFTENVTHLVVDEVGSEKYKEATKCGLPVMVSEWVTDVWTTSQYQHLHGANKYFKKFRCPIFKGLTVSVSQLSFDERSLIQSIIEEHGGTYSSSLKYGVTTHLVLSQPTGDKYCFAKKWGVACVNIQWICASVESGYCKDVSSYVLEDDGGDEANAENDSHSVDVDESPNNGSSQQPKIVSLCDLDKFELSALPKNGQYLDGCKIYLTGFSPTHMDKLRKIVNAGGGMRFSKYSDSISHVVCGEISGDFLTCLRQSSVKPYVINFNWLLECCRNESLVDEKMFLCMDATPLSPEKNETEEAKENKLTLFRSYSQPVGSVRDMSDIFEQYSHNQSDENLCVTKENQVDSGKKLLICQETEMVPERKCLSDFNSAVTKVSRQKRLSRHRSVHLDLTSQFKGCSRKRKSQTSQNNLSKTKLTRGSAEF